MEGTRIDIAIESLEYGLAWLRTQKDLPWREDIELRLELREVRLYDSRISLLLTGSLAPALPTSSYCKS